MIKKVNKVESYIAMYLLGCSNIEISLHLLRHISTKRAISLEKWQKFDFPEKFTSVILTAFFGV